MWDPKDVSLDTFGHVCSIKILLLKDQDTGYIDSLMAILSFFFFSKEVVQQFNFLLKQDYPDLSPKHMTRTEMAEFTLIMFYVRGTNHNMK